MWMSETIVVLVNGEVLADGGGPTIPDQRENANRLASGLMSLLMSDVKVAILHGNKPQVGFVLLRSEIASHILHTIPLDVCGADTQGATGYMLSQAIMNLMREQGGKRNVISMVTQTLVQNTPANESETLKSIGPWYDRGKAETYRQARGWTMLEEPGRGYRRAVPSLPPVEILEIQGIRQLVETGTIVIAAGGGGIPVIRNSSGELEGIEAVVQTEDVACILSQQLNAKILLMIIEADDKFTLSRLSTENLNHLSLEELDNLIEKESISSSSVRAKLAAASRFLHLGGEQVIVTTLRKLSQALNKQNGLRIGSLDPSVEMFRIHGLATERK
jgi:carbamate kinase